MIHYTVIDSPVGPLVLAADDTHLQVLEFERPAHPVKRGNDWREGRNAIIDAAHDAIEK